MQNYRKITICEKNGDFCQKNAIISLATLDKSAEVVYNTIIKVIINHAEEVRIMPNKVMTLCDGKDYFIHYYITPSAQFHKIQISQFNDSGILIERRCADIPADRISAENLAKMLINSGILPNSLEDFVCRLLRERQ